MHFSLALNDTLLQTGDLKSITALFSDLSGLNFAKNQHANWLNKMSAAESYGTYLQIKAEEYDIDGWSGTLQLLSSDGETLRAHLFATHERVVKSNLKNPTLQNQTNTST